MTRPHLPRRLALAASAAALAAWLGAPAAADTHAPALAPCPESPNCVSSLADDDEHRVAPFELAGDADASWRALRSAVAETPRTEIVDEQEAYLHAECTSRIFRFVDDLELVRSGARVDVRSASRTGYGDMGVNRDRVESLRARLVEAGAIAGAAGAGR